MAFSILCGWLIDGSGNKIQKNREIIIENNIISGIRPYIKEAPLEHPARDFLDSTVIPCPVDCHTHLAWTGDPKNPARKNQINATYKEALINIKENISLYQKSGVVAVRDGGDKFGHVLRAVNENPSLAIKIMSPGQAFHSRGKYGSIIGIPVASGKNLGESVQELKNASHMKIVQSGLNSLTEFGKQTLPQFGLEELSHAVKIAKKKGLGLMAHANGKEPVEIAIKAGCRSIEHGFFMGRKNLELMAETGTYWVPTAITMQAYRDTLDKGDRQAEIAEKTLEHQINQLITAKALGVAVALGTDAGSLGVIHGKSVFQEMNLLKKAGWGIAEIINAASKRGAELLGIRNIGEIKPGKKAFLIAVKGEPDKLVENLLNRRFNKIHA